MGKLNKAGIAGLCLCFLAILFGIATNGGIGTIKNFIHIPSLIVTLGGSLFAVLATADSFSDFTDGLTGIFYAYQKCHATANEASLQIYEMSDISRKDGLLQLEEFTHNINNTFLQKGITLVVDGSDPELVKDVLENELVHKEERVRRRIKFWQDLGAYAPAWGMVGTLLGLINMMKSMGSDPNAIGTGMSLALITTLYGSIIANWLCIPIARKLEKKLEQESLVMEIIIEGVLSIQAGENVRIIKEKINAIIESNSEDAESNTPQQADGASSL